MHAVSYVCINFHPAHARIQSLQLRWVNDCTSQFGWKGAGGIDILDALNNMAKWIKSVGYFIEKESMSVLKMEASYCHISVCMSILLWVACFIY